jgi:NADPH2:quinone reductase
MRAVVVREFGQPEALVLEQRPDPMPQGNQVVVDVKAVSANFVDLLMIADKHQSKPKLPFTPGKLPAGIVSATGPQAQRLKVGDRVIAYSEQGSFAEKVVIAEADCYPLPQGVPFVEAAAMGVAYDTAWFAYRDRARLEAGETVLVLGASGAVGLAAIALGKAMGAKVLAGIANMAKAEMVRKEGADAVIDLSAPNLHDSLREQVYQHTAGKGADVILDPLGGDIFDAAIRALAWRGRLVVIGFAAGRIPTIKANYLLVKNIEVTGLQISDYRKRRPQQMAACFDDIFALWKAGKIPSPPTTTYPLEDFAPALASIRDRKAQGRVVLTVGA